MPTLSSTPCETALPIPGLGGLFLLERVGLEIAQSRAVAGDRWLADFEKGFWRSDGTEVSVQAVLTLAHRGVSGRLCWRGAAGTGLGARGRFIEGWLALSGAQWAVRLGRASITWTPLEAALLISPHARPLDMVHAGMGSSARPCPLGRLEAETFFGRLDDPHRVVPDPLVWGMRAGWVPAEGLRLEALRTIMLGGEGRGSRLQARDLWRILWGRAENTSADALGPEHYPAEDSDQKLAWQIMLRPGGGIRRALGMHDLEALWIYAGEDRLRGLVPTAPARGYGLRLHPGPGLALSAFFVNIVDDANLWYHHKVFLSGYTYRGVGLGHPAGGDARTWRANLFFALPEGTRVRVGVFREKRGYRFNGRGVTAGGFWAWTLSGSVPARGARIALTLGGMRPWGGDKKSERIAQGYAILSIEWPAHLLSSDITREEVWGLAD
ncbi:MAG: capsule assembly Wzi family protein [Candidatus Eisenbacteria bacterium]